MAAISLTDFTSQQADIQRRQKLAEMLSEQGNQEIPIQSYNGIQAAIPWTAVLAKALQAGAGAYIAHRSTDQENQLRQNMAQSYAADTAPPSAPASQDSASVATTAPVAQQPMPAFDPNSAAPGEPGTSGPSGPNPQAIAAALASDPTAAPASSGADPQTIAAALGEPPPQAQAPTPMPAPDASAAPPPQAPPVQPAPQAQSPQPVPAAAPANPLVQAQAAVQQARQVALKYAGTPYAADATARVTAAQEQVKKIADLQDAANQKQQEVVQDRQDATKLVGALPLPPEAQALLGPIAQMGGMKALTPALTELVHNQLGPHESYLNPQQMQAAGYAPGSIVVVNSATNEPKILVDGNKVANDKARLALAAQNTALHAQTVGIDRQKLAFDQQQKASAVLDPATIKQMAMQARQGDTSVFQNLGRGVQGAQNIVALRQAIFDPANGPMTGAQQAQMNANFKGVQREQAAIGNRAGQAATGASEVPILAQQADQAYSQLSRTDLVPYNQLKRMFESGTSNPQQKAAFVADNAAVIARARALSPSGVPHLADIKAGEGMLNDAVGPNAHRAVLNQFILEARGMKEGAANAMGNGQSNMAPLGQPAPGWGKAVVH